MSLSHSDLESNEKEKEISSDDNRQRQQEGEQLIVSQSSESARKDDYPLSSSSAEASYNHYGRNRCPPFINTGTNNSASIGLFKERSFSSNFPHRPNPPFTHKVGAWPPYNQFKPKLTTPAIRHPLQPQRHQQNCDHFFATSAQFVQKQDDSYRHLSQQKQTNPSAPYRDLSTNLWSSVHVEDPDEPMLVKLKKRWDAEMQIDIFIQSEIQNLPQPYQDLFNRIVKSCHKMISKYLTPHWSTTFTRCAQIIAQKTENTNDSVSSLSNEIKTRILEKEALILSLDIYLMQKVRFDKAVSSCLNEILNVYEDSSQDEDPHYSQTVQEIVDKINLQIKRLWIGIPIDAHRHQIPEQVISNQVVIVQGQTGTSKRTQILQYVAELNIGNVICTQPTKIAAMSLANNLYQKSHNDSVITFITDITLLNILVHDPILSFYGCVIVDQAHQRNLYTDILLAFLKKALSRRHDLKLIILSTSVDTEIFSRYFNDCPTINVPSKLFPVYVRWFVNPSATNYLDKALDTVVEIHKRGDIGDVLVFLATPDETEKASLEIKRRLSNNSDSVIALWLHDRIKDINLQRIFTINSSGRRRVIFTTNCAEASIAIPGIRYVIDTGLIKERIYNVKSNNYSLRIRPISQSSAIQRCSHAASTPSGICYRLYSQQVYDQMSQSPEPEIKRVDLSKVFLKMIELDVIDIIDFNFIEPPLSASIFNTLDTLHMLSAITTHTSPLTLTSKGKLFCKLPLEPRLSALIMNAKEWDLLPEGIVIASALSMSCNLYCRYISKEDKHDSDAINSQFCYCDGDIISTAAVYTKWQSINCKKECGKWCQTNKINRKLMEELHRKVGELEQSLYYLDIIDEVKLEIPSQLSLQSRDKLRQLIFLSYSDQVALFTGLDNLGYITMCNNQYLVHKSSPLLSSGKNPKFIVYQKVVTTWDNFLTNITPVDEKWLQSIDDRNTRSKISDMLDNVAITQKIDNLGSIILSEYHTNNIDKTIKELLQEENIRCNIIKNAKDSNLEISTIKSKMPKVLDIINEAIMHKKEKLIKAIKILCKEDSNDTCRLIIGRGIIAKDILLPSDCVEFKITLRYTGNGNPDKDTAMDAINEIRAVVMSCGELAVDINNIGIDRSNDDKNIQIDKIVFQQISSQSLLKGIDMKIISGYEVSVENGSLTNCNITRDQNLVQFRLPRRLRNGYGSIICRDRSAAIKIADEFPLTINDQKIYETFGRLSFGLNASNRLHLRQIPNSVSATQIRMAIPLPYRDAISQINFHREDVNLDDYIPLSDLESTLRDILDNNGFLGKYSKLTIKKNLNVVADVIFLTHDDAVSAVQSFNDVVYEELINEPLSVRLGHSRIIKCQQEIYACVAEEIHLIQERIQNFKRNQEQFANVRIYPPNKIHPETSIIIRSWNELRVNEIVRQIGRIIEPIRVQIDMAEIFDFLNIQYKNTILPSLIHRFKVYPKIDWKSQCILIYGIKEEKEKALDFCQKEINRLNSMCHIIDLVGNGKPKGLVKLIIKKYGINVLALVRLSGADIVRLNRKNKTLIVIGEKESFATVLNEINLCCDTLQESKEKSSDQTAVNECVACFCVVGDDHYRLQYCGHLYCQECIIEQINHAIKSISFPLNCAHCNEGFVIEDLERLLIKSPQPRLFEVLQTEFIRRNPTVWHFCPTPECESVYKKSEDYEIFTCPECRKKICRSCDTYDHPGNNCEENKLYRNNPDASIEKFLKENSDNIKKCPECSAAIEKSAGCLHMECTFCHTHFCWLCLIGYKTSRECYAHLQQKHGGCFGREGNADLYNFY